MNIIEKANMEYFHENKISSFGSDSVKALGWKNLHSQQKRFEILVKVGDINDAQVLDLGCGHGDLRPFLDKHFNNFTYIGIDQMSDFIEQAKTKYGHLPKTYFLRADFSKIEVSKADYILASGAFGYKSANELYYWETISKMIQTARKGVAFNMLVRGSFPEHHLLRGHDPEEVLSFCKAFGLAVEIETGYLDSDFTIFVRK